METMRSGTERARATLEFLRKKIVSGQWPVDSKIPIEAELEKLAGVGRTTIREAVRSLASLGMLETSAGRGTFVRSRTPVSSVLSDFMSDFSADELLSYRRALEIEAAQQAALNRSERDVERLRAAQLSTAQVADGTHLELAKAPDEFHKIVFETTHSALLAALYSGVMSALGATQTPITSAESVAVLQDDHKRVLGAIINGDPVRAAHAMALHIDRDLHVADDDNTWAVSQHVGGLRDSLTEITED